MNRLILSFSQVLLALSLLVPVSMASVATYIGPDGGDWHLPANWDTGSAPTAGDDVVVEGKWVRSTESIDAKSIRQTGGAITIGGTLRDVEKQEAADKVSVSPLSMTVSEGITIDGGTFSLGGRDQAAHVSASIGGDLVLTGKSKLAVYAGPAAVDFSDREEAAKAIYRQADVVSIGGELHIGDGATIYPENEWITGTPVIFKPVDFTLEKGATIDTRQRGWGWKPLTGALPPGARMNPANSGKHYTFAFGAGDSFNRGGGYGGYGGLYSIKDDIGCTYGNTNAPFLPGSPNGLYQAQAIPRGSGSVCILASGHAEIDGAIVARGLRASTYGSPSGGGVWIAAKTFRVGPESLVDVSGADTLNYTSGGGGGRIAFAAGLTAAELDAVALGDETPALSFSSYALPSAALQGGFCDSHKKRAGEGTCTIVHNPMVSVPVDVTAAPGTFGIVDPPYGTYAFDATALPAFTASAEIAPSFYLGSRHYVNGGYVISNRTGIVAEDQIALQRDPLSVVWLWQEEKTRLRLVVGGTGTIRCNGVDYTETTELWVPSGTELVLEATAGDGATFRRWAGDFPGVVSENARLVVTNRARMMVTADFGGTGAAKRYIGPDGGFWHVDANWEPAGVPTFVDDVTLPPTFVKAYGIAQAASLTQEAGGALAIGGSTADIPDQTPPTDSDLPSCGLAVRGDMNALGAISLGSRHQTEAVHGFHVGGDLLLDGSAALALYAPDLDGDLAFYRLYENAFVATIGGALRLEGKSVLYPESSALTGRAVKLAVGGDVHVAEQAKVDANVRGWGWLPYDYEKHDPRTLFIGDLQYTLAPGYGKMWTIGGGYGGGNEVAPQKEYGYRHAPFLPGSPAGSYGTYLDTCRGGGVVWIQAKGTIALDGTITTVGGRGWSTSSSGSGGGVWLLAGKLTAGPAATIDAEGDRSGSGNNNAGGAGGRVSIALGLSDAQIDALARGEMPSELSYSDVISILPVSVLGGQGPKDGTTGVYQRAPDGTCSTVLGEVREIPIEIRSVPEAIESETIVYGPDVVEKGVTAVFEATSAGYGPGTGKTVRYTCAGYVVSNQTEEVASGTTTRAEFVPESGPLTLTWLWKDRETQSVISVSEGGTVALDGKPLAAGDNEIWASEERDLTLSATAAPGHEFLYWVGEVPLGLAPRAEIVIPAKEPLVLGPVFRVTEEPMTRTWVGGDKRLWLDPQGWAPAGIPGLQDDIIIPDGYCFASNYVEAASLTLGGAARLRIASTVQPYNIDRDLYRFDMPYGDTQLGDASLVVHGALSIAEQAQLGVGAIGQRYQGRLAVGGDLSISGEGLLLIAAGELQGAFTHASGSGFVKVGGTLSVEGTGAIHVVSEGYTGGSVVFQVGRFHLGPAATICADGYGYRYFLGRNPVSFAPGLGYSYEVGASHGGIGRYYPYREAATPYGFVNSPVQPGSPSGSYRDESSRRGGGLIRIHSSSSVSVEGTLTATGDQSSYFGGPSGGGIWLTANRFHLAPTARLDVKGAPAAIYESQGAGGRVALGLRLSSDQIKSLSETGECPANGSLRFLDLAAFAERYPGVTIDLSPGGEWKGEDSYGTFRFLDATQPATILQLR